MQILFSRLDSITFSNVCGLLGLGIFVFCRYGLLVSPLCKFPTSNILISELEKKKKTQCSDIVNDGHNFKHIWD